MKTACFYLVFMAIGAAGIYGGYHLLSNGAPLGQKKFVKRKYGRQRNSKKDDSKRKSLFFHGYKGTMPQLNVKKPNLNHFNSRSRRADVIQLD